VAVLIDTTLILYILSV